jgi:hypothetical protein
MDKYVKTLIALVVVVGSLTAWVIHGQLTKGDITPNDEFFTLSIGRVPDIDADAWELRVDGLVDHAIALSYENVTSMPPVDVTATLECVEGPSGTAVWTGVRLRDVLALAGLGQGARDVVFHAADGYNSSVDVDYAMGDDVLLAWGMNGEPLPRDQGFPLKVVAPGKDGYKWVKWVERVEVVGYDHEGYWESRGWDDTADKPVFTGWAPHAILLSLAALFGGLAMVSGMRFSQRSTFWRDLPAWFSRRSHIGSSVAYLALLFATFAFWTGRTLEQRGSVFYSMHGRLALLEVVVAVVGLLTGTALSRGRERARAAHYYANLFSYLLLLGVILSGLILI